MEEQEGGGGDNLGLVANVEIELQGMLDSYPYAGACGGNNQQDQLAAMAGLRSTFQGVEPMGTVEIFVVFFSLSCKFAVLSCWFVCYVHYVVCCCSDNYDNKNNLNMTQLLCEHAFAHE